MPRPIAAATVALLVMAAPVAAPATPASVDVLSVSTLPQPESASNAASQMPRYIAPRVLFRTLYARAGVQVRHGEPLAAHGVVIGTRGQPAREQKGTAVNSIIYIIGLVVVVVAVLSFFGLR